MAFPSPVRQQNIDNNNKPSIKDGTTRTIALVLLWTFAGSIFVLFLVNILIRYVIDTTGTKTNIDLTKDWFDLLKNGLILLGTALTTIIGYYFGQREGTIKAEQAERKVEETDQKAQKAIKEAYSQRDEAIKETIANEVTMNDIENAPGNDPNIQIPQ